jgi:hypothetical protein
MTRMKGYLGCQGCIGLPGNGSGAITNLENIGIDKFGYFHRVDQRLKQSN